MDNSKTVANKFGIVGVGDRVAYPGRSGSSMWMNFGTVVDIVMRTEFWSKKEVPVLRIKREGSSHSYRTAESYIPRLVTVSRTDYVIKVS